MESQGWSKKSKSYKINYFGALGELFKRIEHEHVETVCGTEGEGDAQEVQKDISRT